jgi:hypothetical protein
MSLVDHHVIDGLLVVGSTNAHSFIAFKYTRPAPL